MARQPKNKKEITPETENISLGVVSEAIEIQPESTADSQDLPVSTLLNQAAGKAASRDRFGLIPTVKYHYDDMGFVDWRKMVKDEYVVLNRYALAEKGIDVSTLTDEELNEWKAKAKDEEKLIKLAGFKEVAWLRGVQAVSFNVVNASDNSMTVVATITWLPNFENELMGVTSSGIATASILNTEEKYAKYLSSIAENRAFVRAVRNGLRIHSLGQDEINNDEPVNVNSSGPTPQSALAKVMEQKNLSFEKLKENAIKRGYEWDDNWKTVADLDVKTAVSIFSGIQKKDQERKASSQAVA